MQNLALSQPQPRWRALRAAAALSVAAILTLDAPPADAQSFPIPFFGIPRMFGVPCCYRGHYRHQYSRRAATGYRHQQVAHAKGPDATEPDKAEGQPGGAEPPPPVAPTGAAAASESNPPALMMVPTTPRKPDVSTAKEEQPRPAPAAPPATPAAGANTPVASAPSAPAAPAQPVNPANGPGGGSIY